MPTPSQQRRARNEQAIQDRNRSVERSLANLAGSAAPHDLTLNLNCECSDLNCTQEVTVQMHEYEAATASKNQFIIVPRHEQQDIEQVVESHHGYAVVEKHSDLL